MIKIINLPRTLNLSGCSQIYGNGVFNYIASYLPQNPTVKKEAGNYMYRTATVELKCYVFW